VTTQTEVLPLGTAAADAADAALARGGDMRAFERIYGRHVSRVHSLARRMIGDEAADDATQEAFVRVWQKLDTFRGDAALGTWIHRVAVNLFLARRRTLATDRTRFLDAESVAEPAGRPDRPELRMDFEDAIARLPDRARQVFVLHDVEGYRHEEIGELLGVNAGTSKSQLHRARMLLREHLER
jgi:RNA polymerase sigma factor (sigma-70 family)